ncbi:hypothetical protein BT63DRAFT_375272 [Microthyrium microscopicum]|uniref:Uncharacterized protein n=1 Tax=Microthyrium microscopicum TaxID=703497 RepID=A0A6A6U7R3_9PEZI|nr:hypothetical protein BT63DRAFT_375272 [Microthyrium microscopicum]
MRILYAEQMEHYNKGGRALWDPPRRSDMRVGTLGYFNDDRVWNPMALITDPEAVKDIPGLTPMTARVKSFEEEEANWSPLKSSNVAEIGPSLELAVSAPGLPIEASASLTLKNSDDFGCVLTVSNPVKKEGYYGPEGPWRSWMDDNLKAIQDYMTKADVKKYGLFIVTKTYSVKSAIIAIKDGRSSKVALGFSAKVPAIGELGPHADWSKTTSDEAIFKFDSKGDDMRVVIVQGIYFTLNFFNKVRLMGLLEVALTWIDRVW